MKKIFLIPLFCLLLVFVLDVNEAVAGEVLIETHDLNFSRSWGRDTFTVPIKVAVKYTPAENQMVCKAGHQLYRNAEVNDNLILSIYSGGSLPESGPLLASKIIPSSAIPILGSSTHTFFEFDPCVSLESNMNYWFVWSRSKLQTFSGYNSQFRTTNEYPNASYWSFETSGPYGWTEFPAREWSFRLEGPDVPDKTPVLIIPGIAGTELYNGNDLIWADLAQMFLDNNDEFLSESLMLNENGESIYTINIGNAIKRIFNVPLLDINIFRDLEDKLVLESYLLNQNLFYFPYDWLLDLTNTAVLLNERVEQIKSDSGSQKINIVAHSMGGLLAKEYIRQYGKDDLNKLVFIGTPHIGAPKAGKIIIAGDKMGIPWLEEDRIEELGEHSIAVHELLPNKAYFDEAGYYLKEITSNSENLLDYNETKQFLLDNGSTPNVFTSAENFFANNLENINLEGIDVYNIAGCQNATHGGYEVRKDGSIAFVKYLAGDKTVPLVSADFINLPDGHKFYTTGGNHAELPSQPGIRDLIADILTGQASGSYENTGTNISACTINGQELIWRSPVEVHIYSEDRHTGPIDGGFEYGIPGVDYEILGHEKFIFIPRASDNYNIVAKGLDTGTFDLFVRQNVNGEVTEGEIFNNIPVTASTSIQFEAMGDVLPDSINIDEKSTGNFAPVEASLGLDIGDVTTPDSIILDIENAYKLGWIESERVKNELTNKIETAIRIESRIEKVEGKLLDRPEIIGRIERLEKRLDKMLAIKFLNQLGREYNKSNINEQAYNLLKEDIEWLLGK